MPDCRSVASCSKDCMHDCCGLDIILTYSNVHNCWILSLTGVILAITSIASAAAWALAPNIVLRHRPCTCSSNLIPFSVMVVHAAIENSQHWRIRHLYYTSLRCQPHPGLLLINQSRSDGNQSWPCWLTDSGWRNHKVVTCLAQDRESSPPETSILPTTHSTPASVI